MPCKLDDNEIIEFNARATRSTDDLRKLEDKKKSCAAEIGQQIKEKRAEVNALLDCALSGIEHRDVTVYDDTDRAKGIVQTIRSDTGEVIETRHLSPAELQTTIDDLL